MTPRPAASSERADAVAPSAGKPVLELLHDHCGVDVDVVGIDGAQVSVRMKAEPMTRADWTTHDYNVHFCVGLRNTGDGAAEITLAVNGGAWEDLPDTAPLLYAAAGPHGPFAPLDAPARTDLGKRYVVRLSLEPGETIYVANTLPRDLETLSATYDRLAGDGGAARTVFGRTLDGREMVAYTYGAPDRQPTILVTSGFHPPEPDTLATTALMELLSTDAGRAAAGPFAVVIVPIVNPDGYARGTQAANAAGINLYWRFDKDRPDRAPEAAALWELACGLAPVGYIDFHAYTFQSKKHFGPYARPGAFYTDPRARAAAAAMYRHMTHEGGGAAVTGFSAYAPTTLGSLLAERCSTVTAAKFHLHLKDGVEGCRRQGLDAFRAMVAALDEAGLGEPKPRAAAGAAAAIARRARILWAGCLRPNLGQLRRGRLRAIRLARAGLDRP